MTPQDWAMYHIDGADKAADELNDLAAKAINTSANRSEAETKLFKLLDQYSSFGVADTEGVVVANELIDLAFPYR
jgi:hypothetical protein